MSGLISRQAAIDAIHAEFDECLVWDESGEHTADEVERILDDLPSAQPTDASCWGCNCTKMERLKEQKTFSGMVHLHDAETHDKRTETHGVCLDTVSRQAAIDALDNAAEQWDIAEPYHEGISEFWRKRADFYSDMCMDLIGEMGKGVKVESVKISENGIEFIKEQPSAQPEIIRCGDCKHWICHDRRCGYWNHGVKPLDWCCHAERRNDGQKD